METKKTVSITFRCRKKLVEKLPSSNKHTGERSQYLNDAVQNYQELLQLQLEGKMDDCSISELGASIQQLQEQRDRFKGGLIAFFNLFQQNEGNIEMSTKQGEKLENLLEFLKNA